MKIIGICGRAGSGKDTLAEYLKTNYGYVQVALADPMKRFVKDVFHYRGQQLWGPSQFRNEKAVPDWVAVTDRFLSFYKPFLASLGYEVSPTTDPTLLHEQAFFRWLMRFREFAENRAEGKTSPRIVLQSLGTEWGRNSTDNPDMWVNYALNNVLPAVVQPHYTYQQGVGVEVHAGPPGIVISDVRFRNEIEAIKRAGGKIIRVQRKELDDVGEPGITNHQSEAEMQEMEADLFSLLVRNDGTIQELYEVVDIFMQTAKD